MNRFTDNYQHDNIAKYVNSWMQLRSTLQNQLMQTKKNM